MSAVEEDPILLGPVSASSGADDVILSDADDISDAETLKLKLNSPSSSTSSDPNPNRNRNPNPNPNANSDSYHPDHNRGADLGRKRRRTEASGSGEECRRLFQRLWTDEDEVELLRGFLEFTKQRRAGCRGGVFVHDTAPFYDHIKSRLQLEFNKNQLVEKLRRLKKKYRTALARIVASGGVFAFKTLHDQTTFEISSQIWSSDYPNCIDDIDRSNGTPNPARLPPHQVPTRLDEAPSLELPPVAVPLVDIGAIEDAVKRCMSPLFKELLHCIVINSVPGNLLNFGNLGIWGMGLSPLSSNFRFGGSLEAAGDERWRKQQILELEVFLKRLELVQEQIKSMLAALRSMDR